MMKVSTSGALMLVRSSNRNNVRNESERAPASQPQDGLHRLRYKRRLRDQAAKRLWGKQGESDLTDMLAVIIITLQGPRPNGLEHSL